MDYKQNVQIFDDFRKMMRGLEALERQLGETINTADCAIGDCRHKLELDYPTNRKDRTLICQKIRDYGIERRNAKDTLMVLEEMINFAKNNKTVLNQLDSIFGKTKNALKNVEKDRVYKVRVLKDLFGDTI